MIRAQIVQEALSWVGTRYAHQASAKGVGCDCIGLIGGVGLALGFEFAGQWAADPSVKGYGPVPNPSMLLAGVAKYLDPITVPDAGLGDVLLLRFVQEPHHFAIISSIDPMRVVHAYVAARKVCETPIDGYWRQGVTWRSLIVSAWRYKEVGDTSFVGVA